MRNCSNLRFAKKKGSKQLIKLREREDVPNRVYIDKLDYERSLGGFNDNTNVTM
jgi:hypothetical protein